SVSEDILIGQAMCSSESRMKSCQAVDWLKGPDGEAGVPASGEVAAPRGEATRSERVLLPYGIKYQTRPPRLNRSERVTRTKFRKTQNCFTKTAITPKRFELPAWRCLTSISILSVSSSFIVSLTSISIGHFHQV
ncbi:unnamed protein product, partial [Nesidiocoris tenuis]